MAVGAATKTGSGAVEGSKQTATKSHPHITAIRIHGYKLFTVAQ